MLDPSDAPRAGYEARGADDAPICMQQHGIRVGLVLSDVVMLGQSGCELGQLVLALWPHAEAVLISACAPVAIDRYAIGTSGVRLLPRPVADTPGIVAQLIGPARAM